MTYLQVQVLGKLRLRHDETVVERFPTRRVEELLAFLLLNQSREHTREHLIDMLWPDHPPSNGRASLSTALWRMSSVFRGLGLSPEHYLNSSRDWINLAPSQPLSVDAVEFETYLEKAEKNPSEDGRLESLKLAVDVYKGTFCEGIYSEWCLIERERLERKYLWALGVLMGDLIRKQSYEEALTYGQAITNKDPLREEVHRAIMLCYWKDGDSARSIRQFQTYARMLQDELGIFPLQETIDLHRRIVQERVSATLEQAPEDHQQQQLRSAFQSFQTAAENLEMLMTAAEDSSDQPR
jgi:LuxR family maltose regulon positive regulatory protein